MYIYMHTRVYTQIELIEKAFMFDYHHHIGISTFLGPEAGNGAVERDENIHEREH